MSKLLKPRPKQQMEDLDLIPPIKRTKLGLNKDEIQKTLKEVWANNTKIAGGNNGNDNDGNNNEDTDMTGSRASQCILAANTKDSKPKTGGSMNKTASKQSISTQKSSNLTTRKPTASMEEFARLQIKFKKMEESMEKHKKLNAEQQRKLKAATKERDAAKKENERFEQRLITQKKTINNVTRKASENADNAEKLERLQSDFDDLISNLMQKAAESEAIVQECCYYFSTK